MILWYRRYWVLGMRTLLDGALLILQVSSSKPSCKRRIVESIEALHRLASRAVVLYDGSSPDEWTMAAQAAARARTKLEVRSGIRPESKARVLRGRAFYPKMLFWLQAVDIMARHEYIWFADEDISFRSFDLPTYWVRFRMAFRHRGPPVVSQPTIAAPPTETYGDPRGKWIELLNAHPLWSGSGVAAFETSYVEQQAALVEAAFFLRENSTWQTLARAQYDAGSDFALDTLWCGAASLYASERVACAIIPIPIEHDDTRALNWTANRDFMKRSKRLEKRAYTAIAPKWWALTQQLRSHLALNEITRLNKSHNTCMGGRARQGRASKLITGGALAEDHAFALSTRIPCQLPELKTFPRQYAHIGDVVLDASMRRKFAHRTSPSHNWSLYAHWLYWKRPRECCVRGTWNCCL